MAGPDTIDIGVQIADLENRVDRLRALYEQYFQGFERLEPLIPRKDVERRFDAIRRSTFRNTALRFKFSVIQQKYNTYQMYWTRVCRQIEAGTFKRHLQRANAILNKSKENAANKGRLDSDFGNLGLFGSDVADAIGALEIKGDLAPADLSIPMPAAQKAPPEKRPRLIRKSGEFGAAVPSAAIAKSEARPESAAAGNVPPRNPFTKTEPGIPAANSDAVRAPVGAQGAPARVIPARPQIVQKATSPARHPSPPTHQTPEADKAISAPKPPEPPRRPVPARPSIVQKTAQPQGEAVKVSRGKDES